MIKVNDVIKVIPNFKKKSAYAAIYKSLRFLLQN